MTSTSRGALAAAIIGSATVFLDGTIVNVALPRIGATLPTVSIGVLEGQVYIVAGYMATLAAFLLLAGAMGDRYGRRRMFLVGFAGFGVTSLACAFAPSLDVLAAARLLQGVAAALLVPGSLAIITAVFERPERGRAFGIWAASTSVVAIFGPPIGGTLVEVFGWSSIFLVNAPLVAIGMAFTLRYVPELRTDRVQAGPDPSLELEPRLRRTRQTGTGCARLGRRREATPLSARGFRSRGDMTMLVVLWRVHGRRPGASRRGRIWKPWQKNRCPRRGPRRQRLHQPVDGRRPSQ